MLYHLSRLVFPLIISNILHMIAIKKGWGSGLNRPINVRRFGANKTWRGFLLLPLFNALAVAFFSFIVPIRPFGLGRSLLVGAFLGLVYMLFELPNSWLKRRLGIASGERSGDRNYLFLLLDKSDSAFGVSLAYYLITDIDLLQVLLLFLISSAAHILFSLLLVSIGIKKSF